MRALSERRKADRAKMADKLVDLLVEHGVLFTRTEEGEDDISPRRISIRIKTHRELGCAFDFDGHSIQPDVFVNPWNIGSKSDACLSDRFPGSVNKFHFRKSTTVCNGFDELLEHVGKVLIMAADGTAFDDDRERRAIAKDGTWQERDARWKAGMTEILMK